MAIAAPRAPVSPLLTAPGLHPPERSYGGVNTNARYWVKSGLRGDGLALTGETGNYASSPNIAAYNITGDLEIVARITSQKWATGTAVTIIANYTAATSGYEVGITTTGALFLNVALPALASSNTTAAVPFADGGTYWVKITRVAATGVVTFQYALDQASEPTSWTTLAGASGASGDIVAATAALTVGIRGSSNTTPYLGGIMRTIVRNGIAGTTVYDADFAAQTLGASSFTESSANAATVTINVAGVVAGLHDGRLLCNGSPGNLTAAYVADNAALTVTGEIDIRCLAAPTSWTPASQSGLVSRWGGSGNGSRAYTFNINTSGTLSLSLCQDNGGTVTTSATSSVATGFAANAKKWVRVTWQPSTFQAKFYTCDGAISDPAPGDWVQLGTTQATSASVTATYPTTAQVSIGEFNTTQGFTGSIYRAQILNGIAGTTVLDADFTNAPMDVSWFPENANGLTVHIGGGQTAAATAGNGTWSTGAALTNHWATRSNGYPGASIPNSSIDVIFDRYSGHGTVTLGATVACRSFDSSDAAYSFAQSSFSVQVGDGAGGAWTYGSRTTTSGSGAPIFTATSNNGGSLWPIRTNGVAFPNGITFSGAGGGWKLMDTVTIASQGAGINHTGGTLDFNSQTITSPLGFASSGAVARRLIAGAATFNITGSTSGWSVSGSNYQMSCDDLTINMGTGILTNAAGTTSGQFSSGTGVTYGSVNWYGASMTGSTGPFISGLAGSAVVKNMTVIGCSNGQGTPGFGWGPNFVPGFITITNLTMRGFNATSPLYVASAGISSPIVATGATPLTPSVANPPTLVDVIFVDTAPTGAGAPWSGTRLQDGGGNSNITFGAGQTNYWVPTVGRMTGSGFYCGSNYPSYTASSAAFNYASVPDSVPLSITGDIDIRVSMDRLGGSGTQGLVCKGNIPGAATRSYFLNIGSTGIPSFFYSLNGSTQLTQTATQAMPYGATWLRVTRATSTGIIIFYTSSDGVSWNQLGASLNGSSGALYNSPDPLYLGVGEQAQNNQFQGTLYRVQILNGIGGTVAFDADFTVPVAGTTSFTESSANAATVTINTAASTGSGLWSDVMHWASATGGTAGTGRVPLAHDDIRCDASSGTGTMTMDRYFLGRNWDFTSSSIATINQTGLSVGATSGGGAMWGSIIIPATTSFRLTSGFSGQALYMKGRSALTIDTNGAFWGSAANTTNTGVSLIIHNLGNTVTFASDFNAPTTALVNGLAGSVITGSSLVNTDKTITIASFTDAATTTARTIDFGTGVWNLTSTSGTVMTLPNQANLTILGTPNFVVPETMDGVVQNGAYRIPQPGTPPSNTTVLTALVGGNNWWETWAATGSQYTGDLDIRVKLKRDYWTDAGNAVNLISKNGSTPGFQWIINCTAAGSLQFTYSLNGTTQIILAPSSTGQAAIGHGVAGWIRFTRIASTGAYAWYYSLDATNDPTAVTWTSWGSGSNTSGTLFDSTAAPLTIGHGGAAATTVKGLSYYYAGVSNSVASWTPVASIDFTSMADYALSYTDAQSNVWRNHQSSMATSSVGGKRIVGGALMCRSGNVGDSWLTPDSAALSITGDIDIQVRARATSTWAGIGNFIGKWNTAGQRSWAFSQAGSSGPQLRITADGTNATGQVSAGVSFASVGIANGQACWVRATWRQSDGRVQFFYAADSVAVPSVWTQMGTDKTIAAASIFDGNASLEIGTIAAGASGPFVGDIHRTRVLNGIGGTVAFDADFSSIQDDTFAFKESSANLAIVRNTNGTSSAPNRVVNNLDVNKNLPGTITATPSSRVLYFHPITNSITFPAISITGGKWVKSSQSFTYVPASLTLVSTATGPRSAYFSATDASIATTSTGGTVLVQYTDVYNSTAAGASIPFHDISGFDASGNTNWLFLGLLYSTLPMMGV